MVGEKGGRRNEEEEVEEEEEEEGTKNIEWVADEREKGKEEAADGQTMVENLAETGQNSQLTLFS